MPKKVKWCYYIISYVTDPNTKNFKLTEDICGRSDIASYATIESFWESGSNDTTQEMRDKKIDEILDEDS